MAQHASNKPFSIPRSLIIIIMTLLLSPALAFSETDISIEPSPPTIEEQLKALLQTVAQKEALIAKAKSALKKNTEEIIAERLKQQIANDEDIINGMREQFIHLSAGGRKIFDERKPVNQTINWEEDLTAIFLPLVERLKEISERPKKIEAFEQEIAYWEKRKIELTQAANFLQTAQNTTKDKKVQKELKKLLIITGSRNDSAEQKLSILHNKLLDVKSDKSLLWQNISELLISFASSILYYFVIALFLAYVAFQIVVLIARIPKLLIDKKQPRRYVFAERSINFVKNTVGFIIATTIYLTVLYASGQWVLLVISLFLIAGFILTLKNMVPKYFVEIRTLLNLGSIRQNERIVFNGLTWKINLIDVYTHIHNPALDAHLRVPIEKLINLSSRPFHKNEPWFPTKTDDVVLLEDGIFGRVKLQSVDVVEISFGGSTYSYPTKKFLDSRPRNLSSGFTVYEVFGFDYQHQPISTTSMLEIYSRAIQTALNNEPFSEFIHTFDVEFNSAASSSLDFKVVVGCSGEAAGDYFRISRVIQKASVDVANENDWTIPFQQITVHQAQS